MGVEAVSAAARPCCAPVGLGHVFHAHRAPFPIHVESFSSHPHARNRNGASSGITQCNVQLLVGASQGKHLLLCNSRKVAEGCGNLGALAHIFTSVQPRDEVTGQLRSLPLPEGGKATDKSQIHGLPNQCRQ